MNHTPINNREPEIATCIPSEFRTSVNISPRSRQHRAEARSELAEVKPVDDPVPIEVQVAQIVGIADLRSKGVSEEAEIEAVDDLVAVDVAEEAEEALGVAEGVVAARWPSPLPSSAMAVSADLRRERRQRVAAIRERTKLSFALR